MFLFSMRAEQREFFWGGGGGGEAAADEVFISSVGGCRVVLFHQEWNGPEEKWKCPSSARTPSLLISLLLPLLTFSASPRASLSLSKKLRAESELSVTGAARRGAGRVTRRCQLLHFWPSVVRLGHLSIQEGPHRCPHYAGSWSSEAGARGAERCGSSAAPTWPLSVCHSPYREEGRRTPPTNYNKHNNNNPADAGAVRRCCNDELGEHHFQQHSEMSPKLSHHCRTLTNLPA